MDLSEREVKLDSYIKTTSFFKSALTMAANWIESSMNRKLFPANAEIAIEIAKTTIRHDANELILYRTTAATNLKIRKYAQLYLQTSIRIEILFDSDSTAPLECKIIKIHFNAQN